MQKYLVVFKKMGDPRWQHTFAKKKSEVLQRAKSKLADKELLSVVWCIDWKDADALPESVMGIANASGTVEGKSVAASIAEEYFKKAVGVRSAKPHIKLKAPAAKPKDTEITQPSLLPVVVTPTKKPESIKAVEEYKRPYDVEEAP